ncbi:MAG: glucosamine-6-phosphate isomerase [Actinobacteria bacterium]|nr:glucosamine-6-phosphate isomerase [Cyanobacteriota bacterium]MCL5771628.1 glucosamine-6-phosphate isomerase [Actinomycetota bacterium]
MRNLSKIAPEWWDYTTLDEEILKEAAKLTADDMLNLSRPGFTVKFYDTLESFYVAEALEYIYCWQKSTSTNPVGICGPIGPTEQLPLVAEIVNDLEINVKDGHFWAMDEWFINGKEAPITNPLSFAKADMDLCFNKIRKDLRMPDENIHFLRADNIEEYSKSYDSIKCLIMQGGQGETKHWAFNDPVRREGRYKDSPPLPEEFRKLNARVVKLHPITLIQNARTSAGGVVSNIPSEAITVGPVETWKSDKVSIWHAGMHDNPFGMRLTTYMISKKIQDSSVPMSLLADHSNVQFNFYKPALGTCEAEMH